MEARKPDTISSHQSVTYQAPLGQLHQQQRTSEPGIYQAGLSMGLAVYFAMLRHASHIDQAIAIRHPGYDFPHREDAA
jgi:hypothetical protein